MRQRVLYSGRVQGVGFRATAQRIASERGVTGWVRNEHDGRVLLEVQGDGDAVGRFLSALDAEMAVKLVRRDASGADEVPGEDAFVIRR